MSDLETFRVVALLCTHCLVGLCSALEGSPFNCNVFPIVLEGLRNGLRNLMFLSDRPGLVDLSQFYWQSPYCFRVSSSIRLILAGGILVGLVNTLPFVGLSWSRGSLMIKGLRNFRKGLLRACKRCPRTFPPCLLFMLSLEE